MQRLPAAFKIQRFFRNRAQNEVMKKDVVVFVTFLAASALLAKAESKIKFESLPAPVQQAVKQEQSKGATLMGLAKEVEAGKTLYEAEFKVANRSRDIMFDSAGKAVTFEDEVAIDSIPAGARDAIRKFVAKGELIRTEAVTENGKTFYEVQVKKGVRKVETKVNADGSAFKK